MSQQPSQSAGGARAIQDRWRFYDICLLLDQMEQNRRDKSKIRALLTKSFQHWRASASDNAEIDNAMPLMRLLLPHLDLKRGSYNLKEPTISKLYIECLGLNKVTSADAQTLINWKESGGKNAGVLYKLIGDIMKSRAAAKPSLTLREINESLDQLAAVGRDRYNRRRPEANDVAGNDPSTGPTGPSQGPGRRGRASKEGQAAVLDQLIKRATALEHRWLVAIILRDLKCGFKDTTVFSCFHDQAEEFYHRNSNLEALCKELHGSGHVDLIKIRPGDSCGVMLAKATRNKDDRGNTLDRLIRSFGDPFLMEIKWDGERIHLHKDGSDCWYFSRNRHDFTNAYCTTDTSKSHWHNVQPAFAKGVHSCILDGEMLGYNTRTHELVAKDDNFDVKALARPNTETNLKYTHVVPLYLVWDIIYLNGHNLLDMSMIERRRLLEANIQPVEGRLHIVELEVGHGKDDFLRFANHVMQQGHEGVIVKRQDSRYCLGQRGGGWWKWKPEYHQSLQDTLDLVIVGGYFGEGSRRSGAISHFMLAVAEDRPPDAPAGWKPTRFHSCCKVGTGYSFNELERVRRKLAPHWHKWKAPAPGDTLNPCGMGPGVFLAMPNFKERPDYWIPPDQSIVVEMKAASLIETNQFATGLTLRFPRLVKFRDSEKDWFECATISDLRTAGTRHGQLVSGVLDADSFGSGDGSPAKRAKRAVRVHQNYGAVNVDDVQVEMDALKGREFLLDKLEDTGPLSRETIASMIKQLGGQQAVASLQPGTIVISDSLTFRVRSQRVKVDVVKPVWILHCYQQRRLVPLKPRYMVEATEATTQLFRSHFDDLGDSYVDDLAVDELDDILRSSSSANPSNRAVISCDLCLFCAAYRACTVRTSPPTHSALFYPLATVPIKDCLADIEECLPSLPVFRGTVLYFDVFRHVVLRQASTRVDYSPLLTLQLEAKLAGAELALVLDERVTHVVMDEHRRSTHRLELQAALQELGLNLPVVHGDWVKECLAQRQQVDLRPYTHHAFYRFD